MPITDALPVSGARPLLAPAARATIGDYVTLTKPRIMSLLVLTAVCAMVAGARRGTGPGRPARPWRSGERWPAAARARSTMCWTATSTA